MTAYRLKSDRFGHPEGAVVYQLRLHDYGLAHDDTLVTGIEHVSVTLNANGGYPFFTVPNTDLELVSSVQKQGESDAKRG